jgi:dipeptidyl-peptidase-4
MVAARSKALVLLFVGIFPACAAAPPGNRPAPAAPVTQPAPAPSDLAPLLPETASRVSFAEMAKYPEPGWNIPRAARFSPDGKTLTFLMSEGGDRTMALHALDLSIPSATPRVLVRAADLASSTGGPSLQEELRNERQRKRIEGITDYAWASRSQAIVLPAAGDLFVRTEAGKLVRVTDTPEPELDPKISPDGTQVAFVRDDDVFVADVASGKVARAFKSPPAKGWTRGQSDFNHQEEFDEPSGLFWSSDGKRIIALEVNEGALETTPVLGFRKGKPDLMMQRYPVAGATNPTVRVRVAEIATHREAQLELPKSVPSDAYLGRIRSLPDGESVLLTALDRKQKTLALVLAAPGTSRTPRVVARFTAPEKGWIEVSDLVVHPGGKRAFLLGPSEGRQRPFEIDLGGDADAGTARTRVLTSGPGDATELVGYDETSQRLLFMATTADEPIGRQLFAVADGAAPVRLTTLPGTHEVTAAPRGGAWFDLHSSASVPPSATVHGAVDHVVGLPAVPEIAALGIRTPEPMVIETPDGVKLHGAVLAPRTIEPGKRYPLVLMVYGGPGVQTVVDRWAPRLLWQHLADRGFFVAQFDNRGSSGRGYDFATPIAGRLGEVELADQLTALDALGHRFPIDPDRAAIYGHSYGGFLALAAMLRAPGRFSVGIAGSPVTDWRLYDSGYTERFMGTPADDAAGYDASELSRLAPALGGHLLVVHALMDENVHFQNSANLFDALIAAKKPFDMFVFPGERHGYRSPAAREYAMQLVTRYLVEHLSSPRTEAR